ncbi:hypothetical protein [Pelovirga terrestris]|uniref:Bulb-type lectin domain-containing protein n=1 Tax=Pelovirga terrestris TaxID=2771352 RepID=A0A8J6QNC7_9BACT|nr:hypothetical protein [Pelovirga terrestris]MBD1399431.1 hypothetical protein [Pelovirga terrestris]
MKKLTLFLLLLFLLSFSLQGCGSGDSSSSGGDSGTSNDPDDPTVPTPSQPPSSNTVLSSQSLGELTDLGDYLNSPGEEWFFASTIDVNSAGQIIGESPGNRLIFWDPANPMTMEVIPLLPGSTNADAHEVLKINDHGLVIGNRYSGENATRAFIWNSVTKAITNLDDELSLENTLVADINGSGAVVLTADTTDDGRRAYFWDGQSGSSAVPLFGILGSTSSESVSLNDHRQVVILSKEQGVYYDLTIGESNGYGRATLNTLPGVESSTPVAINNNKRIAGTSGNEGFFWAGGVMYPISNPNGDAIEIVGMNNNDIVIGNSGGQAFIWQLNAQGKGEYSNLGTLRGSYSHAVDINDQNEIVGYSTTDKSYIEGNVTADVVHGFLWKDGTMYDLGAHSPPNYEYPFNPDFYSSKAVAISETGIVTGISFSINSHSRGFTLTPTFP